MALSEADVELIRASWVRARTDPVEAGALLFRGLFTKFPDYLKLFNQFDDLDLERIQEHKRLVKHAVKVIETVTYVVDSIGDPAKGGALNDALVNLVRGHAKRSIGTKEFQNLGIVLIDFICDLNHRRYNSPTMGANAGAMNEATLAGQPNARGGYNSSTSSSQDSGTMTSTLDKIRASLSPSSSSDDDNIITENLGCVDEPLGRSGGGGGAIAENHNAHKYDTDYNSNEEQGALGQSNPVKLDTSQLVLAWKKLYKIILDLVAREANGTRD